MYLTRPSARLRKRSLDREGGVSFLQDEPVMKKERETKDDGRYIIFYTFEDEGSGDSAS